MLPGGIRGSLTGGLLPGLGQLSYLSAIIGGGGGDVSGQEMPERVDCHVQLGALLALGAIIARPGAALRTGAQGAAIENRRRRLRIAPGRQAQHGAKVVRQLLKAAGVEPALRLLIDAA